MAKNYEDKNLPELFLLASQRGIKKFITKDEKEMRVLLREWDDNHEDAEVVSQTPLNKFKSKNNNKKGFHAAAERLLEEELENIDDLIDVENLEEESVDETTSEKVHKRLGTGGTIKTNRDSGEQEVGIEVEDDTENFLEEFFENDTSNKNQVTQKKEKVIMSAKKSATKIPVKRSAQPPKKQATERKSIGDKAPYQEGTAGYCAFIALKKGGTLETIVKNADILVQRSKSKPPANTAAKVKIIMTEINAGKKGDKWGKFVVNEKTKRISWQEK